MKEAQNVFVSHVFVMTFYTSLVDVLRYANNDASLSVVTRRTELAGGSQMFFHNRSAKYFFLL